MDSEMIFLCGAAILSLGFSAVNGVMMALRRNRTVKTTATVVTVKTISPESIKRNNSKWAQVSYKAEGKVYTPTQRIQVPMTAVIGSKVTVRYDKEMPQKLYDSSGKVVMGAVIGILFLVIVVGKELCR